MCFLGFSAGKESAHNVRDLCLISGLGRSPGESKNYPLWYSGLENSMDYIIPGLSNSSTCLSDFHFYTVKGIGPVKKAEVDDFLELSHFFNDLTDVNNLISGSSAFSKYSLTIWKFTVRILLMSDLENFEHYIVRG